MSTTTQAPSQLDPSASLHPETLGLAPGRGRLQGRRIIVVGAGQRTIVDQHPPIGNGRAMSVLFAREGAHVACIDINKEAADDTVAQIASEGGKAFTEVVDVSDASAIAPAVERCVEVLLAAQNVLAEVQIETAGFRNGEGTRRAVEKGYIQLPLQFLEVLAGGRLANTVQRRPATDRLGRRYVPEKL